MDHTTNPEIPPATAYTIFILLGSSVLNNPFTPSYVAYYIP